MSEWCCIQADIMEQEIKDLERKLAEAQADNISLAKAWNDLDYLTIYREEHINKLINGPMAYNREQADYLVSETIKKCKKVLMQPHPGADLIKELEQLRARLSAYNGFEPCDFKSLDAKNKELEESKNSYTSLVPELLQLRRVRDELMNYRKYASVWCDLNENHAWQRVEQALSQAKAGDK